MKFTKYYSFITPVILFAILLSFSYSVLYPLFIDQFSKSKDIISLFREKETSADIQERTIQYRSNAEKLSRLITTLDSTKVNNNSIIDALYAYADSAKFRLNKVETGQSVSIEQTFETPYIIQGKGSYFSVGSFIQHIENNKQSTRIRQLVMNNAENRQLESLIEFVVIGE
jgi:Tfp pilus assembly protein PilO